MNYRWITLVGLLALSAAARADVQVNFVSPEKFSDIRDNEGFRQPDLLKGIKEHLVTLAGEVEPFGRHGRWLRVMRAVTSPAITLSYEVREGGKVIHHGEAKLRDMDYQNSFNTYSS